MIGVKWCSDEDGRAHWQPGPWAQHHMWIAMTPSNGLWHVVWMDSAQHEVKLMSAGFESVDAAKAAYYVLTA